MHTIRRYEARDEHNIDSLLGRVAWAQPFAEGQLASIRALAAHEGDARVYVAYTAEEFRGFITALFAPWNRLGQIHGLVVHPDYRRRGLASDLITAAETFVRERGGRGVFVDTPIDNKVGRGFYEKVGYRHDYTMTAYYDDGLDGVTYVKFF